MDPNYRADIEQNQENTGNNPSYPMGNKPPMNSYPPNQPGYNIPPEIRQLQQKDYDKQHMNVGYAQPQGGMTHGPEGQAYNQQQPAYYGYYPPAPMHYPQYGNQPGYNVPHQVFNTSVESKQGYSTFTKSLILLGTFGLGAFCSYFFFSSTEI